MFLKEVSVHDYNRIIPTSANISDVPLVIFNNKYDSLVNDVFNTWEVL